jgi:DNA-binding transcriptional regulator PaaX
MRGARKYTYYVKKPRSAIVKDVLDWLFVGGVVAVACTSPYMIPALLQKRKSLQKYPTRKVSDTFYRLRKQGFIIMEKRNRQLYISLTPEGKQKAGVFQIDKLRIQKPKHWDKKWRLLLFDIPEKRRVSREALRGKLKEFGFMQFQKSVWVHPYNCKAEMELLQEFFGLSRSEMQLIIAESLDGDRELRKEFHLSF